VFALDASGLIPDANVRLLDGFLKVFLRDDTAEASCVQLQLHEVFFELSQSVSRQCYEFVMGDISRQRPEPSCSGHSASAYISEDRPAK